MFLIIFDDDQDQGAFSIINQNGDKVLYFFTDKDDATRYSMMLEDFGNSKLTVLEYDDELLIKTCEITGNKYTIITSQDIVVPPKIYDKI